MNKSMGHFTNWKFGVPVKVYYHDDIFYSEARLIAETNTKFKVIHVPGGTLEAFLKSKFHYELIPYKSINATLPRYPVCVTGTETAYCNSRDTMGGLFTIDSPMEVMSEPTATLIIDGKEIKLSAETAALLKAEFGA